MSINSYIRFLLIILVCSLIVFLSLMNQVMINEDELQSVLQFRNKTSKTAILLITSWRSGSTYMGELLTAPKGSFFFLEPFDQFSYSPETNTALEFIDELHHCNFTDKGRHTWRYNKNFRKYCIDYSAPCWMPGVVQKYCELCSRHVLKVVRKTSGFFKEVTEKSHYEKLQGVLLVRDPRAVWNSRKKVGKTADWCKKKEECIQAKYLCQNMTQNYNEAKQMLKEFPHDFVVIRYEDFVQDINAESKKLFKALRLPFDDRIESFIASHARQERQFEDAYSTFRDPNKVAKHWIRDLDFSEVTNVQSVCREAMHLWGYKTIERNEDLNEEFEPVMKFSWRS